MYRVVEIDKLGKIYKVLAESDNAVVAMTTARRKYLVVELGHGVKVLDTNKANRSILTIS